MKPCVRLRVPHGDSERGPRQSAAAGGIQEKVVSSVLFAWILESKLRMEAQFRQFGRQLAGERTGVDLNVEAPDADLFTGHDLDAGAPGEWHREVGVQPVGRRDRQPWGVKPQLGAGKAERYPKEVAHRRFHARFGFVIPETPQEHASPKKGIIRWVCDPDMGYQPWPFEVGQHIPCVRFVVATAVVDPTYPARSCAVRQQTGQVDEHGLSFLSCERYG